MFMFFLKSVLKFLPRAAPPDDSRQENETTIKLRQFWQLTRGRQPLGSCGIIQEQQQRCQKEEIETNKLIQDKDVRSNKRKWGSGVAAPGEGCGGSANHRIVTVELSKKLLINAAVVRQEAASSRGFVLLPPDDATLPPITQTINITKAVNQTRENTLVFFQGS